MSYISRIYPLCVIRRATVIGRSANDNTFSPRLRKTTNRAYQRRASYYYSPSVNSTLALTLALDSVRSRPPIKSFVELRMKRALRDTAEREKLPGEKPQSRLGHGTHRDPVAMQTWCACRSMQQVGLHTLTANSPSLSSSLFSCGTISACPMYRSTMFFDRRSRVSAAWARRSGRRRGRKEKVRRRSEQRHWGNSRRLLDGARSGEPLGPRSNRSNPARQQLHELITSCLSLIHVAVTTGHSTAKPHAVSLAIQPLNRYELSTPNPIRESIAN